RRTDTHDVPYTLNPEGKWHVLDPSKNTEPSSSLNSRIGAFDISEDKLFLQLQPIDTLTEQLVKQLWPDEDEVPYWKQQSLSSISRPIHCKSSDKKEIARAINQTK